MLGSVGGMEHRIPFPIWENQQLNVLTFKKKSVELSEEQFPVSNNLKVRIFYMYSIYFQAAKICNNMLLAISMIGTAEAMNLGIRFVD